MEDEVNWEQKWRKGIVLDQKICECVKLMVYMFISINLLLMGHVKDQMITSFALNISPEYF